MPLKRIYILLFILGTLIGQAQDVDLSPLSKISVLTAGSGSELYSSFGHSAIHVEDPSMDIDAIYNYGTFDFTTPNFYTKFARGKLNYTLSRQRYPYFLMGYEQEKRWVKQQVLDLSLDQRQALFEFLETNYLPGNRDYKYDFFYNNCATKIWDVLKDVYGDKLQLDENYLDELYTHRQLIHQNVPKNSWSGFGIDLALGSVIDDMATPKEHMFLPEYVMKQLGSAQLGTKRITAETEVVLDFDSLNSRPPFFLSPAFWLSIVLILIVLMTFLDVKYNTRRRWLDFLLFFVTGTIGCVIIFLWFFTDHTATAGNFNILWAFPANLVIAFVTARKRGPTWVAKYALFLLALILITLLLWLFGVQVFSPLLLLVGLALAIRYFFLFWSYQSPKIQ
ncbi:DUF4105 domain-containing protein [Pricia sp. S334]|uniref:DUF4105 domain-containing protein n=1 Tax=Pricia mediterranea TaxID=3076079 RepID=A0ABU3L7W8_9FLAO|nr:DUF4105 domain-containing protein [Pricia sp. S334]MDT7829841.1 DUF4105 domain-containing protein [Pricia sp. S334]